MILIQMTGLSGSGKTTLAYAMKSIFEQSGYKIVILDGDEYRKTLCKDLGFSRADRIENNRRLATLGLSLIKPDTIIIIATINPYEESRLKTRRNPNVYTVWTDCPIEILIQRDTKGLYHKVLNQTAESELNLSGINDPYELPKHPDLILSTHTESKEESIKKFKDFIIEKLNA